MNEHILCAAIWFDDGNVHQFQGAYGVDTGFVLCGFRHPYILDVWGIRTEDLDRNKRTRIKQGFLTSTGRFVERKEARTIAVSSGQLKEEDTISKISLCSEDLYPTQYHTWDSKNKTWR